MLSLYFDIVILVISHFSFEGGTLVLVASDPGHCLSFTFQRDHVLLQMDSRFVNCCLILNAVLSE